MGIPIFSGPGPRTRRRSALGALQPSLSMMCCTWVSTVRAEMTRLAAIWPLDWPAGHQRRHVSLPAGQLAGTRPAWGGGPAPPGRTRWPRPGPSRCPSRTPPGIPRRAGPREPPGAPRRDAGEAARVGAWGQMARPGPLGHRGQGPARTASSPAAAAQASASRQRTTPIASSMQRIARSAAQPSPGGARVIAAQQGDDREAPLPRVGVNPDVAAVAGRAGQRVW